MKNSPLPDSLSNAASMYLMLKSPCPFDLGNLKTAAKTELTLKADRKYLETLVDESCHQMTFDSD
jgi:hypothetical protein